MRWPGGPAPPACPQVLLPPAGVYTAGLHAKAASQKRHASKVERYEQMRTLGAAGFTVLDIAQIVGATRRTVYRYLALQGSPERQESRRSRHRVLAPYEP